MGDSICGTANRGGAVPLRLATALLGTELVAVLAGCATLPSLAT